MKKYDTFIIGHITKDEVREPDGSGYGFYGGAALFSSYAAVAAGAHTGILTKMAADQQMLMDVLVLPRNDIWFIPSEHNTSMLNQYMSSDRERRRLVVSSVADPFTMADIPNVESEIFHLAGLICGDFAPDMIPELAKRGRVAVDMQGYLRCLDRETMELFFKDYPLKQEVLPHIHFLKTDAAEAEILTGSSDRVEAAKRMHSWGAKEIVITHNTEVLAYDGNRICTCPIRSRNFTGRTGRGDTTFAAYMTERLHSSMDDALHFATAMVSLKMETPGPFKQSRAEVKEYLKTF